jgi:DNA polymerase III delta subunit
VFWSKDLDARKKFSKRLVEHAAVVTCDEVLEVDRPRWIHYLAQRKSIDLKGERSEKHLKFAKI